MSNTISITLGGTIIAMIMFGTPAAASPNVDLSNPAFAPATGPTSIPVGAAEFCKSHRDECAPNVRIVDVETLTQQSWDQLVAVNDDVNRRIVPETDQDLYNVAEFWSYPDGRGDCEDFALEKRRQLLQAGWDASTLLMTVVRERNGNGHAVLMVRTDRGDLVLDNQDGRVRVWQDTPYEYIKRQSQTDAGKWVGLADSRATIVAAAN
ncbi:MAG: transglutaminase-like cysteine peptidase [Devosia nanyangense]|uniref:Transglutaminase-like cysteine peptidase n=1 Tax=Devosia nanyangense TaxID=1228055 RepID=A0A933KZ18_9HYPH|nr:transglutaminase-like cysteine peptidase [Devosia nanyangense]